MQSQNLKRTKVLLNAATAFWIAEAVMPKKNKKAF